MGIRPTSQWVLKPRDGQLGIHVQTMENRRTRACCRPHRLEGSCARDAGKPFELSSRLVGAHVRNCLPTEIQERIRQVHRSNAKVASNTHDRPARPDHRARRRAEEILILAGVGRETVATLRSSIPLSETDFQIIHDFFGAAFARNLRTERNLILREFDNLVSQGRATDPEIGKRRARIVEINRRSHGRDRARMRDLKIRASAKLGLGRVKCSSTMKRRTI